MNFAELLVTLCSNFIVTIWVNFNISLTWILRPFGDDSPQINHDFQGSVEQWGRDEIYPELCTTLWLFVT